MPTADRACALGSDVTSETPGTGPIDAPPPTGTPVVPDDAPGRRPRARLRLALLTVWSVGLLAVGGGLGWMAADRFAPPVAAPVELSITSELPAGDDLADATVRMPDVTGLDEDTAREVLATAGVDLGRLEVTDTPWVGPAGRVVQQSPLGGTPGPLDVELVLATEATVPDVVGEPRDAAVATLDERGAIAVIEQVYDPDATVGDVVAVEPATGEVLSDRLTLRVAAPGRSVFLTDLRTAGGSGCRSGAASLGGTSSDEAYACTVRPGRTAEVRFELGGRLDRFVATVGPDGDGASAGPVRFELVGDGDTLEAVTVAAGEQRDLDVRTSGVGQLTLRVVVDDEADSGTYVGVWGEPRLIGTAEAVAEVAG